MTTATKNKPAKGKAAAPGQDEQLMPNETPVVEIKPSADGALTLYDPILSNLAEMRKRFGGKVYDLTKTKQDDEARRDRKSLVSLRTSLERLRLDANKADRATIEAKIKSRDELAEDIEQQIREVEEPISEQIKARERQVEEERERRMRANEARVNAHLAEITSIGNVAVRLIGKTAAEIEAKVQMLVGMDIGSRFEEFEAQARVAHAEALSMARSMLATTQANEAAAARQAEQEAELEKLREQQAETERRERAAQADRDRLAEEARVAAQREQEAALAAQRAEMEADAKRLREETELRQRRLGLIESMRETAMRGVKSTDVKQSQLLLGVLGEQKIEEGFFGDLTSTAELVRDAATARLLGRIAELQQAEIQRDRDEAERAERERIEAEAATARVEQARREARRLARLQEQAGAMAAWIEKVLALEMARDLPAALLLEAGEVLKRINQQNEVETT